MKKLIPAALLLALLAACVSDKTVVVAPVTSGVGVVESVAPDPEHPAPGGAAGSSTKLIAVRMGDNTVHYYNTRASGLKAGQRVEIAADGTLRRP
ncbi:MAG TPA: hypothetical protein VM140_14675 [Burkholderiales bacterium]|nr:hypothetical protein [Burkholderiales bacterium]